MLGEERFKVSGGVAWLSLEGVLSSSATSSEMALVSLPLSGPVLVVGRAASVWMVKSNIIVGLDPKGKIKYRHRRCLLALVACEWQQC